MKIYRGIGSEEDTIVTEDNIGSREEFRSIFGKSWL